MCATVRRRQSDSFHGQCEPPALFCLSLCALVAAAEAQKTPDALAKPGRCRGRRRSAVAQVCPGRRRLCKTCTHSPQPEQPLLRLVQLTVGGQPARKLLESDATRRDATRLRRGGAMRKRKRRRRRRIPSAKCSSRDGWLVETTTTRHESSSPGRRSCLQPQLSLAAVKCAGDSQQTCSSCACRWSQSQPAVSP